MSLDIGKFSPATTIGLPKMTPTEDIKAAYTKATKDGVIDKGEQQTLDKMVMSDGKIDSVEENLIYKSGYKGTAKFEFSTDPKVSSLIQAGMLEKQGKLTEAADLLRKNGFIERAQQLDPKDSPEEPYYWDGIIKTKEPDSQIC